VKSSTLIPPPPHTQVVAASQPTEAQWCSSGAAAVCQCRRVNANMCVSSSNFTDLLPGQQQPTCSTYISQSHPVLSLLRHAVCLAVWHAVWHAVCHAVCHYHNHPSSQPRIYYDIFLGFAVCHAACRWRVSDLAGSDAQIALFGEAHKEHYAEVTINRAGTQQPKTPKQTSSQHPLCASVQQLP
jgi:hypothetical protein